MFPMPPRPNVLPPMGPPRMMPPGGVPGMPPMPGSAITLPPGLRSDMPMPQGPGMPNPMAGGLGMQPPAPPPMMGGMPPGMGMPGMPMMGGMNPAIGPIPQPPPPPPPPTLWDAMQQADGAALLELLMDQFEQSQGDKGPIYPKDFKRPKRPDPDKLLALVEMDRRGHAVRNERIDYDIDVANGDIVGVFPEDAERRWYEYFPSPALANELETATNFIASLPSTFEVSARDPKRRDEAQDCEDTVYWAWDEIRDQWDTSAPGDLDRDLSRKAVSTGWVAARLTPDPSCSGFPFIFRMFDIRCVYPKWDGHRGLERVSVVYQDTLSSVVADYDNGSGKVRRALSDRYSDDEFDDPTLVVTVSEVWDRWWRAVYVDSTTVCPVTAHKYGFVPWVIQPCGGGEAATTAEPVSTSSAGRRYAGYSEWNRHAQGYKSTSLIRQMVGPFLLNQKLMGKLMTRARHADNPSTLVSQTVAAQRYGIRPIDITPGTANPLLKEEEDVQPFAPQIPPEVLNPLSLNIGRDMMASSTPGMSMGQIDKSNVTGVAMESANEAGTRRYTPCIRGLDTFRKRIGEMVLKYVMDMGDLLGEDGERGELMVPRRNPSAATDNPAFTLTQDTVRAVFGRSYPRVKVRSTMLSNQQRIAMMNMYQMGIKGNIFSERWARNDFGIENPEAMRREILEEQALHEPDIAKILMYRALEKGDDPRSADLFHQFVLMKPGENQQQGGPGAGGPPSGIGSQGGVSMPMQGIPSGQSGGRPPMPLPPGMGM